MVMNTLLLWAPGLFPVELSDEIGRVQGGLAVVQWSSLEDLTEQDSKESLLAGEEPQMFIHQLPVVAG